MGKMNTGYMQVQSGYSKEQITEKMQDLCLYLEKMAEQNKPVRPENISDLSTLYLHLLSQDCAVPPAMERMFRGADSYLNREKMLRDAPKTVIYCIFSFARYLLESMSEAREQMVSAEQTSYDQIEEDGELLLKNDQRMKEILDQLAAHDDLTSALKQSDLQKSIGINTSAQMSAYMKRMEKYDLWYTLREGRSKRYFITDKGRRVLRLMQENENSGSKALTAPGQAVQAVLEDLQKRYGTDKLLLILKKLEMDGDMSRIEKKNYYDKKIDNISYLNNYQKEFVYPDIEAL